jgi:hypothetical protein
MAQSIIATITDIARQHFAEMLQNGKAFTITDFVSGSGGHDAGDPASAISPDPTVTTLPLQTFGPKAVTSKTLITPFCVQYLCDLDALEAVGPLSNLGLIATFTYSPIIADPIVGTQFLFAVANFPLAIKTDSETRSSNLLVQF